MQRIILLFGFALILFPSLGQNEIQVMSYNVLNYTEGTSRADTLEKIFDYYTPDLLLLQELKTANGLAEITARLNTAGTGNYVSGTFVDQVSNPTSSWKLQQNIVYNTDLFGLAEETIVTTNYRDVNYFKLYLQNSVQGAGDTVFLHVFVTHLKSSQGSANEQLRYEMAQTMRTAINALPANSLVLCGGDFNLYTSSELAYQHLLQQFLPNQLNDPINAPGDWNSPSFPNKEILTQSTRLTALSDGAGGGVDDRFDFVLMSSALFQNNSSLQYVSGYKALGNNGTCYNQDLTDCATGNSVPATVLSALYHMSDHLPIVFSLVNDVSASMNDVAFDDDISIYPNPAKTEVTLTSSDHRAYTFHLINATGQKIVSNQFTGTYSIDLTHLDRGIYFLEVRGDSGERMIHKVLLD